MVNVQQQVPDYLSTSYARSMLRCLTTSAVERAIEDERNGFQSSLPAGFGPLLESGKARYLLKRMIGRGAHGDVFEAVDRRLDYDGRETTVAIKLMPPDCKSDLSIREAQAVWGIRHPNVAALVDVGKDPEGDYLAMEFLPGGTLLDYIEERGWPRSATEVAELTRSLCDGVAALHEHGLIHCDLKPQNILMSEDGTPKISDFGVSTFEGRAPIDGGRSRAAGCMAFMPPEQYRGRPVLSSDQFALGGMLYWMLTGSLPWGNSMEELEALHEGRLEDWPEPKPTGGPRDLAAICLKAMSPNPDGRYTSVGAMRDDLDAFLARRPVHARRSVPRSCTLWVLRRPWLAIASALVLATSVGAGTWLVQANAEMCAQREVLALRSDVSGLMKKSILQWQGRQSHQFASLWYYEWIFGPDLFNDPSDDKIWGERIDILRAVAGEAPRPSVEALMTDVGLAYWLALGADATVHTETIEVLERIESELDDVIVNEDDPLRRVVAAVRLRAEANTCRTPACADDLAARIQAHLDDADRHRSGDEPQMVAMLATALANLHKNVLADEDKAAKWEERARDSLAPPKKLDAAVVTR